MTRAARPGPRDFALPGLLLAGAALRAWFLTEHARRLPFLRVLDQDAALYDGWARALLGGGSIADGVYTMAPGYVFFLAGVYALLGADPVNAVAVQAGLGLGTVALTYLLARRWFGRPEAVAAGAMLLAYGALYFYEAKLLAATLATFLAVLLAWLLDRATRTPRGEAVRGRTWFALGAGLAAGMLAVTRANLLTAGLLIAAGLAWSARRPGPRRATALAYAAGLALALAPTAAHNLSHGVPVPVSANGGLNFYVGNWSGANGAFHDAFGLSGNIATQAAEADSLVRADLGRAAGPGEADRYWFRKAIGEIAADPARWLGLEFTKLRLLAGAREETNNGSFALEASRVAPLRALALPFNLLFVTGIIGLALAVRPGHRRRGSLLAPVAVLAAVAATALLFFVLSRLRLPAAPFLAVYAAHALVRGAEALRGGRPLVPASAAVLTAVLCVATWRSPLGPARNPAWEAGLFARAAAQLEATDPAEAAAAYRDALALDPSRNDVRQGYAQFLARSGDMEGAAGALRQALIQDPDDLDARSNYGLLLFNLGRLEEATEQFAAVTRADPERAAPHMYLGLAAYQGGDVALAERELLRAQELDPRLRLSYLGLIELSLAREDTASARAWLTRAREHGVNLER